MSAGSFSRTARLVIEPTHFWDYGIKNLISRDLKTGKFAVKKLAL